MKCPLYSAALIGTNHRSPLGSTYSDCNSADCGWWDNQYDRCGVPTIARSLDKLHNEVLKGREEIMEILSGEEINKSYMGSDYHPSFRLTLEVKHSLERVAQAQRLSDLKCFVEWLEKNIERFDADGDLVISLISYKQLKDKLSNQ